MAPAPEARLFVERLRQISKRSVVYAKLPFAQYVFDFLPPIHTAHVIRAIEGYLNWHWNSTKHPDLSR